MAVQQAPRWLILFVLCVIGLFSCTAPKYTNYFRYLDRDTVIQASAISLPAPTIRKGDQMRIHVTSLSPELDDKFNLLSSGLGQGPADPLSDQGYRVDERGQIRLHYLGDVTVEGITCQELKRRLEKETGQYLRDPIFSVGFLNRRVTVLGEVTNPRVVRLSQDPVSLLEVLAASGGMKEDATLSDILVIRDSGDRKVIKHVNLERDSMLKTEWYYVQSDDVVLVKRDMDAYLRTERKRNLQTTLSLAVSFLSLFVVLLNNIIK